MSEVKRYRDTESFLDGREVVLATDYSSLLSVLRRCVTALETHTTKAGDSCTCGAHAALSAARPWLEETP